MTYESLVLPAPAVHLESAFHNKKGHWLIKLTYTRTPESPSTALHPATKNLMLQQPGASPRLHALQNTGMSSPKRQRTEPIDNLLCICISRSRFRAFYVVGKSIKLEVCRSRQLSSIQLAQDLVYNSGEYKFIYTILFCKTRLKWLFNRSKHASSSATFFLSNGHVNGCALCLSLS